MVTKTTQVVISDAVYMYVYIHGFGVECAGHPDILCYLTYLIRLFLESPCFSLSLSGFVHIARYFIVVIISVK